MHVEMGITSIKIHDRVLAAHYGFTDEELDFPSSKLRTGIPSARLRTGNYDITYRMGREQEADEPQEETANKCPRTERPYR